MIGAIAKFELRYHLRQPLFYILFVLYFLATFSLITSDAALAGGAAGNVHRNSPLVIMTFMLILSAVFGVLTTTAFAANAGHRDFELNTAPLFFTKPIRKLDYLGGRFLGSLAISVILYLAVALAMMLGGVMPWLEAEQLGPFAMAPYLFSLVVLVGPNLLLCGAVFFSVAALTRSLMATYTAMVVFIVAYFTSSSLLGDLENERVAALLDPFGTAAFDLATRYWTVHEKNTALLPVQGIFLANRVLWVGLALAIFAFALWKFRFAHAAPKMSRKSRAATALAAARSQEAVPLPRVQQTFDSVAALRQYAATARAELRLVFRSIPFFIIVLIGMLHTWLASLAQALLYGTPSLPLTHLMVSTVNGGFGLFGIIIAAFYAGDMVWRERALKMNEVLDSMPVPTWTIWAGKLTALLAALYVAILAAIGTAMIIQTAKGYFHYEPLVYLKGVFFELGVTVTLLAAFAFLVQIFFNQKFVGFAAVMLYLVISISLPLLGFEHRLYRFPARPPAVYSDMNGWGHFVAPISWFTLYWLLVTAAFFVLGHHLWVRGTDSTLRARLALARAGFGRRAAATLAVILASAVATGSFIYYNTNVRNVYRTTKGEERRLAEYEKRYKRYERLPQPRLTDVQANVDLDPQRRSVSVRGTYTLVNRTPAPIAELHVALDHRMEPRTIVLPGARVKSDDREGGYTIYTLSPPLAPGATMKMSFHTGWSAKGFVNGQSNPEVVGNGTFIGSGTYFPHIGYMGTELQDAGKRRKYGLGPVKRAAPPTDIDARRNSALGHDGDWINLDTVVSTSDDQTAVAPGYLQRTWSAGGRRYFHYRTSAPILPFWSYVSARYTVKRDRWKQVPIEVYYDARHAYNVDRMIDAVKKSLDYYTTNFSPYQHRQVRILEFPRYRQFAQSFPNTIPFSESIGFVADLRDKDDIDFVFYVTAHEVAHQWWGHQVIGGDVQGASMLMETLAQYSALMVMEKEYGKEQMRKFLRHELNQYLALRGAEAVAEKPLMLVEFQQYIHYNKGSLVMYALRDLIGEERVNAALAKFIRDHAFEKPPYTTAPELVRYFRDVTPPQYQSAITDLFETITFFESRVTAASSTKQADGRYLVKFTVEAKKFRADDQGEQREVPVDDWIDVAVFSDDVKKDQFGKVLFMEKKRIRKLVETFEIVVAEKPGRVGMDPFNKLVDRNPKDNTKSL